MDQSLPGIGDLRVIDLGVGSAAALTAKLLCDAGARVDRIEPAEGDPFYEVYPAYRFWRAGAQLHPLETLGALAAAADICILGGEDYPGLDWTHDAERLAALNPRLIVVVIAGYVADSRPGRAVDLLVQARSGLVYEQLTDRPIVFTTLLPTYGASLLAQLGLWAALLERETTGMGQIVRASLQQGMAMFWSQIWMQAERADADFDKLPPKGVDHLIFECADGGYLHLVLGVPGALATVYRILGIDVVVDPSERGIPTLARGPRSYFADADLLAPAILKWNRQDLLEALWQAGIPVEPVLRPGECWDTPQVEANALITRLPSGERGVGAPVKLEAFAAVQERPPGRGRAYEGPLSGYRVVDLGNFIAGPVASKHLADLGADVIKVEPPGGLANLTGLRNLWVCNRGKRSISLDAKSPDGAAILARLCASADVVHYNFRLGVAERMGVDPVSLRKLKPDLVTLQTRAYGVHGPKAGLPGFDMVMQALCGHEYRAGGEGNPPLWYRSALVDYAGGALGAISMMMGLYAKARGGVAVEAEASLLASAMFLMSELVQTPDGAFAGAAPLNHARTGVHPAQQLYQAADGWIAVAARTDAMAQRFAAALGVNDPGPSSAWGADVGDKLAARAATVPRADLLARLAQADVWAEACVEDGWAALRGDPAARANHAVIEAEDAVYGRITSCFGPLVNFSAWRPTEFRSAPASGEHTTAILEEIGYGPEDIADFYRRGIVAQITPRKGFP